MNKANLTHESFKSAMASLKKLKRKAGVCRWDAGAGFIAEAYWSEWRKRIITTTITPEGIRIMS